jgi:SSS family solute:Na+ symporter
MTPIDWAILAAMYVTIVGAVVLTKRHMKSVADFLAAGRSAGRYLLTISSGIAGLGAITVVANLEAGFEAGFAFSWWGLSMSLVVMVLTVTGWVNYRFRRTRALTLAEFFERRYSRRFRVFAGLVAFGAGLINFGIFPAVGARFFIYFMNLPPALDLGPIAIPTFPAMMTLLLGTAVYFVFAGGQVAVMITDFIQGAFANIVFLILSVYLLLLVGWPQIVDVLVDVPVGQSKINPFDTNYVEDFNFTYFLIGIIGVIYSAMSWQGTQAYNTSAKSAHEGKMGGVLGLWRGFSQGLFMTLIPIIVFAVLHHPDPKWASFTQQLGVQLDEIGNEAVRNQMRAPLVLAALLPAGLMGAFAALMLGAFVSTHNTYLHSWGSIFIQDVVLPFRKKPLKPIQHLLLLRLSMISVALFIFVFSLLYRQSQAILLFFALTGAIFAGWSGAVIIGGLYTRWGTTAGAWAAGIVGVAMTLTGFVLEQSKRAFAETGVAFWGLLDGLGPDKTARWAEWMEANLPNGQEIWGHAMWACGGVYILVSVVRQMFRPKPHDLDRLLHRGKHEIPGETEVGDVPSSRGWKVLAITKEFSRRDKFLYLLTYSWNFLWILVFIAGTVFFLTRNVSGEGWSRYNPMWIRYWEFRIWVELIVSSIVIVWFTIGGIRDVRALLRTLRTRVRDDSDDGWIDKETEA